MGASTINGTMPAQFTSREVAAQLQHLQYTGQLELGDGPRVAVIGSQACSNYGEHHAADLAGQFVARGICVAATFTYGADCAALRGGLAAGGRVLGIAAQSLDISYPKGNAALQDRLMTDGLVATVYPEALSPTKQQFLMTRTVLAHLVDAVVIVEAPSQCRSLITVAEALRIGRPVYAVPGPIGSYQSEGTHQLVKDRKAELLTTAEDLQLPLLDSDSAR
jgi:DNA processing protein